MKRLLLLVILAGAIWVGFDLFGSRRADLRRFDPQEVARLETAMWRSYYSGERVSLFTQLARTLREQYGMGHTQSYGVAVQAARAAFTFKEGHDRSDYEKAIPQLQSFYRSIRESGNIEFNVDRAAKLELEWWIIHRERKRHSREDLDRSLADLQAEIYQIPADRLARHANLRAEAMLLRDEKADSGGVSEADWQKIEEMLRASWRSLYDVVKTWYGVQALACRQAKSLNSIHKHYFCRVICRTDFSSATAFRFSNATRPITRREPLASIRTVTPSRLSSAITAGVFSVNQI